MKKYTFEWLNGSLNDNGTRILKENNIPFEYDAFFNLRAKIGGTWYYVQYIKTYTYNNTYDLVFCI